MNVGYKKITEVSKSVYSRFRINYEKKNDEQY